MSGSIYIYAHTNTYRQIQLHMDLHSIGRRSNRAGPTECKLVSASCVIMLHCANHGLTQCNCNTTVSIMASDSRSTMLLPNFRLPLASNMLPEWLLLCFAGKVHRLHQSVTLSSVCHRSYRAGQTHIDLQLAFCLTSIAVCFEIACSLLNMEPSLFWATVYDS